MICNGIESLFAAKFQNFVPIGVVKIVVGNLRERDVANVKTNEILTTGTKLCFHGGNLMAAPDT